MFYEITMRTAAMALICSLAECLIPEGRLKKTVRFAIGLVFVLCIASPIAELLILIRIKSVP